MRTARYVDQLMGMPVSLALRGRHAEDAIARAAWAEVVSQLTEVDRVFSTYRADSYVSRLGRGEVGVADCPPEVAEVLALAERARLESAGAFDVRATGVLDPSGVVKGWAVERAARVLAGLGDTDHCLSAGGDMVCFVAAADGEPWRVGVEHPHDPGRIVAVVPVRRGGVATSGLTHRGGHVIDPRTGRAPRALASVTVVATTLSWADVDATAALVMGDRARDWLEARPGRCGVLVRADGSAKVFGSAA